MTTTSPKKTRRWMWVLGLLGAALIVLSAVHFNQRAIGDALFAQGVKQAMGRDVSSTLPDGLHVFVCGAGSPLPDPTRAGPCLGVIAGTKVFVIDAGTGGAARLTRMGFPVARIERLFLTHLHSDHFDGLGELMLQRWVGAGAPAPLPMIGPTGTSQVAAGFNTAYAIDAGFRTAHHGETVAPSSGFGLAPQEIIAPLAPQQIVRILTDGALSIDAVLVNHTPAEPAFGFIIRYKDRSLAISGDTAFHEPFYAAAKGVDVLFHEALNPAMVARMQRQAEEIGNERLAKIMADIPSYHTSPEDAARAAAIVAAKALVLYHIVPPLPNRALYGAFLGDAQSRFAGPITIAEDGLMLSLPAGGDRIAMEQLL